MSYDSIPPPPMDGDGDTFRTMCYDHGDLINKQTAPNGSDGSNKSDDSQHIGPDTKPDISSTIFINYFHGGTGIPLHAF